MKYVSTDYDGCSYIAAGKWYDVDLDSDDGNFGHITDDDGDDIYLNVGGACCHINYHTWTLHATPADTPTLWRDMTDAEKGALLLEEYEGENFCILYQPINDDGWGEKGKSEPFIDDWAYRIKPKPVVDTKHLTGQLHFGGQTMNNNKYRISVQFINGTPDTASIKMEEL